MNIEVGHKLSPFFSNVRHAADKTPFADLYKQSIQPALHQDTVVWKNKYITPFLKPITYEEPALPDSNILLKNFSEIFNRQLTGEGISQNKKLENYLKTILKTENVSVFNNATSALTTAVKALNLKGEVLISPLGHPSNVNAFSWNGVKPVFVDIDPKTFQIDVAKLEAAISDKTSAIIVNAGFGNPPDMEKISGIAHKHGLKVILDAENIFGLEQNGMNILNFTDVAVFKIQPNIHSIANAGAVIYKDAKLRNMLESLKNYGVIDTKGFHSSNASSIGINGKLTEADAAWVMANLNNLENIVEKRQLLANVYRVALQNISGVSTIKMMPDTSENLHVFPVIIKLKAFGMSVPEMIERFKKYNVHLKQQINPLLTPLLSNNDVYKVEPSAWHENLPVANDIVRRTLLLPLNYTTMSVEDVLKISNILKTFKNPE